MCVCPSVRKEVWENRDFWSISRLISEMVQHKAIVTMEGEQETVPNLSNGAIFNDLEWPLTQISSSRYYSTSNNAKMIQDRVILTMADKYHHLMLSISETVWDTYSFIVNYTRPSQGCHFEWPRVTLSDLVKYPMTRSIARSLCDSWASYICIVRKVKFYVPLHVQNYVITRHAMKWAWRVMCWCPGGLHGICTMSVRYRSDIYLSACLQRRGRYGMLRFCLVLEIKWLIRKWFATIIK